MLSDIFSSHSFHVSLSDVRVSEIFETATALRQRAASKKEIRCDGSKGSRRVGRNHSLVANVKLTMRVFVHPRCIVSHENARFNVLFSAFSQDVEANEKACIGAEFSSFFLDIDANEKMNISCEFLVDISLEMRVTMHREYLLFVSRDAALKKSTRTARSFLAMSSRRSERNCENFVFVSSRSQARNSNENESSTHGGFKPRSIVTDVESPETLAENVEIWRFFTRIMVIKTGGEVSPSRVETTRQVCTFLKNVREFVDLFKINIADKQSKKSVNQDIKITMIILPVSCFIVSIKQDVEKTTLIKSTSDYLRVIVKFMRIKGWRGRDEMSVLDALDGTFDSPFCWKNGRDVPTGT